MEQQVDNSTQPNPLPGKRPKLITILCIIAFIGTPLFLGGLFMPTSRQPFIQQFGPSFIPVALLSTAFGLIGLIGYWKMRKWGVYVYTTVQAIGILWLLVVGIPLNLGIIIPLVTIYAGFTNLKKMS